MSIYLNIAYKLAFAKKIYSVIPTLADKKGID